VLIDELHAFALLIAANAVPVIVAKLARERGAAPLDFGLVMPDGQRLFGSHKTWRGLLSGIAACALLALYLGIPVWVGAGFAAVSLAAEIVLVTACFVLLNTATARLRHRRWL
jgi:CDP-archaeol synthase